MTTVYKVVFNEGTPVEPYLISAAWIDPSIHYLIGEKMNVSNAFVFLTPEDALAWVDRPYMLRGLEIWECETDDMPREVEMVLSTTPRYTVEDVVYWWRGELQIPVEKLHRAPHGTCVVNSITLSRLWVRRVLKDHIYIMEDEDGERIS